MCVRVHVCARVCAHQEPFRDGAGKSTCHLGFQAAFQCWKLNRNLCRLCRGLRRRSVRGPEEVGARKRRLKRRLEPNVAFFVLSSGSTADHHRFPYFHHSGSLHGVNVLKTQFQIPPNINFVPRGMLLSFPAEYLLVEYFPLTGKFQFMWSGKLLLSNKPDANESH